LSTSRGTTRRGGRGGAAAEGSLNHMEGQGGAAEEGSLDHVKGLAAITRRYNIKYKYPLIYILPVSGKNVVSPQVAYRVNKSNETSL
jgi:hypothetical protein